MPKTPSQAARRHGYRTVHSRRSTAYFPPDPLLFLFLLYYGHVKTYRIRRAFPIIGPWCAAHFLLGLFHTYSPVISFHETKDYASLASLLQNLTLESDYFICVREKADEQKQVVMHLADANYLMLRPITADC